MSQPVRGPDNNVYNFPDGTTKEAAVSYFKKKGIGISKVTPSNASDYAKSQPTITGLEIKNAPQPHGMAESTEQFATKLLNDLKHGTDSTGVGRFLTKTGLLGKGGLYAGQPEAVGDFMGSMPIGITRMIRGGGQIGQSGKRWEGTKETAGGLMDAMTLPAGFIAPEAGRIAGELLPTTTNAGKVFDRVVQVAGKAPVNPNAAGDIALRIRDLGEAGSTPPKVITKFLARVTKPGATPLTYSEARDFYSNASELSASERMALKPKMKYYVGQFTKALGDSIYDAAESKGAGKLHNQAMRQYHRAAQLRDLKRSVVKKGIPMALKGAGLLGAYDLLRPAR